MARPSAPRRSSQKLTKKLVVSRWEAPAAFFLVLVPLGRYMTGADEQTYCVELSPNCFCMSFWKDGHFLRKESHEHRIHLEKNKSDHISVLSEADGPTFTDVENGPSGD